MSASTSVLADDLRVGDALPEGDGGRPLVIDEIDREGDLVALRFAGCAGGWTLRRFERVLVLAEVGR